MKNLFSYNLITILNCAKIKALTGKSLNFSNFYQVDFDELHDQAKSLLYLGMTRASMNLKIVLTDAFAQKLAACL